MFLFHLAARRFVLTTSDSTVQESNSFTIFLQTTSGTPDATIPYTITGVQSSDINNVPLTGTFTTVNNRASITFNVTLDDLTIQEGAEVFRLTLDDSATNFIEVNILDLTLIPTIESNSTGITEGQTFTITINTNPSIPNGTRIPYTITGVTSADINNVPLTDYFEVTNLQATKVFTTTIDSMFSNEPTKTFTLTLDSFPNKVIQIPITDFDINATVTSTSTTVDEGTDISFTITASTPVPDNTPIGWTITGTNITTSDLNGHALAGTTTLVNNTATIPFTVSKDSLYGGEGPETIRFQLTNRPSVYKDVLINDYILTATLSAPTSVNEGAQATIQIDTGLGIPDNTQLAYTITGVQSSDISIPLSGYVTIVNRTCTLDFTCILDSLYGSEGIETLRFQLDNTGYYTDITLNDFTLTATITAPTTVTEPNSVTVTVDTGPGLSNGTLLPYTITGVQATDISIPLTGNLTITNNQASVTFTTTVGDIYSAESETIHFQLDNTSYSVDIQVIDFVLTGTITPSVNAVDEPGTVTFTLVTTGISNNTTIPYTITGIEQADINQSLTGNFTIVNDQATITVTTVADNIAEGTQTFTIQLTNKPSIFASVTLNDTSKPVTSMSSTKLYSSPTAEIAPTIGLGTSILPRIAITSNSVVIPCPISNSAYVFDVNPTTGAYAQYGTSLVPASETIGTASVYNFGAAVASVTVGNQTTIAVGAPGYPANSVSSYGFVYIYTRTDQNAITQIQKIARTSKTFLDFFGLNVALSASGLVLAVSALLTNSNSSKGEVTIYTRTNQTSTFTKTQVLTDSAASQFWGEFISFDAHTDSLVVSTHGHLATHPVNVFVRTSATTWSQEFRQTNPAGTATYYRAASIDGDTLVVGTGESTAGTYGTKYGAVYIYRRNSAINTSGYQTTSTWSQVGKIQCSDLPDTIGAAAVNTAVTKTKIVNNMLMFNTYTATANSVVSQAGAVQVYKRPNSASNSWSYIATINEPTATASNFFGWDFNATDSTIAIVASDGDQVTTSDNKSVFYVGSISTL